LFVKNSKNGPAIAKIAEKLSANTNKKSASENLIDGLKAVLQADHINNLVASLSNADATVKSIAAKFNDLTPDAQQGINTATFDLLVSVDPSPA
jgi:hypothetical protein